MKPELKKFIDKNLERYCIENFEYYLVNSTCIEFTESYLKYDDEDLYNKYDKFISFLNSRSRCYHFDDICKNICDPYNFINNINIKMKLDSDINDVRKYISVKVNFDIYDKLVKYPSDKILNLVDKNKYFKDISTKYKENKEKEMKKINAVKKMIPLRYKDLYPLARNIKRHFVLHVGPTNSGKTHESVKKFLEADKASYIAPLRLLAEEVADKSNTTSVACNLITGESEKIVDNATHVASTYEKLNFSESYDIVIIDEGQMIGDSSRGCHITSAILGAVSKEIHICTAPNAVEIIIKLIAYCNDTYEIINHERKTPLIRDTENFCFPNSVKAGDALIAFSERKVIMYASILQKKGIPVSVIYGSLPIDVRLKEAENFKNRVTDVLVATDAIGMGMNLPIKRIVLTELKKYDGSEFRFLHSEEIKQIVGRAGRYGLYNEGYYNAQWIDNNYNSLGSSKCKDYIERALNSYDDNIDKCFITFNKSLVDVDLNYKLSDLLTTWSNIKDDNEHYFCKSNVTEEIVKASKLEKISNNKDLIFSFISIPFNTTSHKLYNIWIELFKYQSDVIDGNNIYNVDNFILDLLKETIDDNSSYIDELKESHQILNLINSFINHCYNGGDTKNKINNIITKEKKKISRNISKLLEIRNKQ